jgi:hypothetical protein
MVDRREFIARLSGDIDAHRKYDHAIGAVAGVGDIDDVWSHLADGVCVELADFVVTAERCAGGFKDHGVLCEEFHHFSEPPRTNEVDIAFRRPARGTGKVAGARRNANVNIGVGNCRVEFSACDGDRGRFESEVFHIYTDQPRLPTPATCKFYENNVTTFDNIPGFESRCPLGKAQNQRRAG